ncbi:hypothetical protein C5B42_05625 [Candidatus Cerribacteria bacterium 'Amazon FNV 2010 28 9']|uniref:Uncharacterized protein n=1 Tax=Candidatus Cerribacteria bacterium 'Amazon FNV 2010 28 9' TaxID=2081795 RepID=A0A317JLV3_9BACT|nr:MAG: hypothetical protein C5B42_05625 [Candidatus Cerribacteria bacterium 'Amazon FNV 2010 28 9']
MADRPTDKDTFVIPPDSLPEPPTPPKKMPPVYSQIISGRTRRDEERILRENEEAARVMDKYTRDRYKQASLGGETASLPRTNAQVSYEPPAADQASGRFLEETGRVRTEVGTRVQRTIDSWKAYDFGKDLNASRGSLTRTNVDKLVGREVGVRAVREQEEEQDEKRVLRMMRFRAAYMVDVDDVVEQVTKQIRLNQLFNQVAKSQSDVEANVERTIDNSLGSYELQAKRRVEATIQTLKEWFVANISPEAFLEGEKTPKAVIEQCLTQLRRENSIDLRRFPWLMDFFYDLMQTEGGGFVEFEDKEGNALTKPPQEYDRTFPVYVYIDKTFVPYVKDLVAVAVHEASNVQRERLDREKREARLQAVRMRARQTADVLRDVPAKTGDVIREARPYVETAARAAKLGTEVAAAQIGKVPGWLERRRAHQEHQRRLNEAYAFLGRGHVSEKTAEQFNRIQQEWVDLPADQFSILEQALTDLHDPRQDAGTTQEVTVAVDRRGFRDREASVENRKLFEEMLHFLHDRKGLLGKKDAFRGPILRVGDFGYTYHLKPQHHLSPQAHEAMRKHLQDTNDAVQAILLAMEEMRDAQGLGKAVVDSDLSKIPDFLTRRKKSRGKPKHR